MMWIVEIALKRPYTFIVMAILIVLMGIVSINQMSTDIFPNINIPVVSIVWTYTGISPDDMEKRIVTVSERAMTTTVNDIEHIESQSMYGVSIIKVYFHPGAKIEAAVAQITSVMQTILRVMPPGIFPPLIIRYDASNVPILQMSVSSKTLSEQELFDYGLNFIRTQLATVQGASIPLPLGGKQREVMVDLNPLLLFAKGITPSDVSAALNNQNLILPSGTIKLGAREYNVQLNSSPLVLDQLNNLPVKTVNNATVYMKDIGHVRDGYAVQTNIVRENGRRSTLLTILKAQGASTLDVVQRIKRTLPRIAATLPQSLNMRLLFDQSIFVRASIEGVIREAIIAAILTALMILIFLGSVRSTLIVVVSIPLSILCSIIILQLLGETLNVMTLGGMALAVGMLVDDATVEVENIHRNMGKGQNLVEVILIGARQVATPALVSTLSICIVFVPVVFITGAAKSLFTPLAMAVVFAMLASYLLSRTLVPVMAMYLLKEEEEKALHRGNVTKPKKQNWFDRFDAGFNRGFDKLRNIYHHDLRWALNNRPLVIILFVAFFCVSFLLLPMIGEDFFPDVDAGQLRLHVRVPTGTRIEETEHYFTKIETDIHQIIPKSELSTLIDNIGLPNSGINLAFGDNATTGPNEGEILIALNEHHKSTWEYRRQIRKKLQKDFPQCIFFYQAANIVNQILNFGLPAPIDIQVVGRNPQLTYPIAKKIEAQVAKIQGAADVHLHQIVGAPQLNVNVDRTLAQEVGLSQQDVANNLLVSLSSSGQTAPNYWLNPKNGVNYTVAVQTPQYHMDSLHQLNNTPIYAGKDVSSTQILSNMSSMQRSTTTQVINHFNVQPTMDIYANVEQRDLGGVADDIDKVLNPIKEHLPRGVTVKMRGQVDNMRSSFFSLGMGLILAIVLVYLLMVMNFQSWIDPLLVMMGTPAVLSGILWMLFATETTFSVPSLMGTIMCVGVATANSILLITFANEQRELGFNASEAALQAGFIRLRPVLMTALAMIIGMVPMAFGLGEGGEQNAPLGRAVIGGLLVATFTTLFLIPILYSLFRKNYTPLPS